MTISYCFYLQEQIHKYCCELLDQAVNMLVDAWKTEKFPVGTDLLAPHMRLVRLPFLGDYMKSENAKNGKEVQGIII